MQIKEAQYQHFQYITIQVSGMQMIQTINIRIHGSILRLSFLSLSKSLSQNNATETILRDINTVQYHNIADQIIRQIHRPIRVVNTIEVRSLSFFIIA